MEEKIAELESWKLHQSVDCKQRGMHVSEDIDHLEERLHRAEAELVDIHHDQRSNELQADHMVSSLLTVPVLTQSLSITPGQAMSYFSSYIAGRWHNGSVVST